MYYVSTYIGLYCVLTYLLMDFSEQANLFQISLARFTSIIEKHK